MTNPQDEALRGEEWDEYKDLTVRDVILIWIGERKSNLDTTILENGMSFLLSSRLAEARADERARVREWADKNAYTFTDIKEKVIDLDDLLTALEITNQHEGV